MWDFLEKLNVRKHLIVSLAECVSKDRHNIHIFLDISTRATFRWIFYILKTLFIQHQVVKDKLLSTKFSQEKWIL